REPVKLLATFRVRPINMLRAQANPPAGVAKLQAGINQREEREGAPPPGVLLDRAGDVEQERLEGVAQVLGGEVTLRLSHGRQVDLERHRADCDGREVSLFYQVKYGDLKRHSLKVGTKVPLVPAVWCCCDSQHVGVLV